MCVRWLLLALGRPAPAILAASLSLLGIPGIGDKVVPLVVTRLALLPCPARDTRAGDLSGPFWNSIMYLTHLPRQLQRDWKDCSVHVPKDEGVQFGRMKRGDGRQGWLHHDVDALSAPN